MKLYQHKYAAIIAALDAVPGRCATSSELKDFCEIWDGQQPGFRLHAYDFKGVKWYRVIVNHNGPLTLSQVMNQRSQDIEVLTDARLAESKIEFVAVPKNETNQKLFTMSKKTDEFFRELGNDEVGKEIRFQTEVWSSTMKYTS